MLPQIGDPHPPDMLNGVEIVWSGPIGAQLLVLNNGQWSIVTMPTPDECDQPLVVEDKQRGLK